MITKLLRYLCDIFLTAVILVALVLVGPRLFGIHCFAVTSGSMVPSYPVGCVVYAVPTKAEEIQAGDVISFNLTQSVVATHRVTAVNIEERSFTTKGDANANEDGRHTSFDSLIGKVSFSLPLLGYLVMWLTPQKLLILLIPLVILLLIPDKGKKGEKDPEKQNGNDTGQENAAGNDIRKEIKENGS